MKRCKFIPKIFTLVATMFLGLAFAADDAQFVGAEKCKNCHSAPSKGDQYGKWTMEKHSKAFQILTTDEAKKVAKAKGIDDPTKAADCLKCHITAFEAPPAAKHKKFDPTLGVQCETCHGPGSKHVDTRLKEEADDDSKLVALQKGEIIGMPSAETCVKCHNKESPSYIPFAFNKFAPVFAHLDPRKKRAADYLDKLPATPMDDPKAVAPKK